MLRKNWKAVDRREATDPRVWCDCFRATIRLSRKNDGGVCAHCKADCARETAHEPEAA
jgi:hypothetical protein